MENQKISAREKVVQYHCKRAPFDKDDLKKAIEQLRLLDAEKQHHYLNLLLRDAVAAGNSKAACRIAEELGRELSPDEAKALRAEILGRVAVLHSLNPDVELTEAKIRRLSRKITPSEWESNVKLAIEKGMFYEANEIAKEKIGRSLTMPEHEALFLNILKENKQPWLAFHVAKEGHLSIKFIKMLLPLKPSYCAAPYEIEALEMLPDGRYKTKLAEKMLIRMDEHHWDFSVEAIIQMAQHLPEKSEIRNNILKQRAAGCVRAGSLKYKKFLPLIMGPRETVLAEILSLALSPRVLIDLKKLEFPISKGLWREFKTKYVECLNSYVDYTLSSCLAYKEIDDVLRAVEILESIERENLR